MSNSKVIPHNPLVHRTLGTSRLWPNRYGFEMKSMNTQLILKILSAAFLLKAASNYNLLIFVSKIDFTFWFQYFSVVIILGYFVSAVLSFIGALSNRKWAFFGVHAFILLDCVLMSPAIPIPYGFLSGKLYQSIFILGFNLILLAFTIYLHYLNYRNMSLIKKIKKT